MPSSLFGTTGLRVENKREDWRGRKDNKINEKESLEVSRGRLGLKTDGLLEHI